MGIMDIFTGGTVKAVGKIIDEVYTSEEEKENIKLEFAKIEAKLKEKQLDINLSDSRSKAVGLSGFMQRAWRPLIGMSCALAIFWEFVLSKFILFFLGVFHYEVINLPQLDLGTLMPLVLALLGMSGIRSFELVKGVRK